MEFYWAGFVLHCGLSSAVEHIGSVKKIDRIKCNLKKREEKSISPPINSDECHVLVIYSSSSETVYPSCNTPHTESTKTNAMSSLQGFACVKKDCHLEILQYVYNISLFTIYMSSLSVEHEGAYIRGE